MKKIWKIRKDTKAVSPVIATILMVAITVVLAAVLYVMVMGFGGGQTSTPTAAFATPERNSQYNYTITIASISESKPLSEFKLSISTTNSVWTSNALSGTGTLSGTGDVLTDYVGFVDIGADEKLGAGDYFVIDFSSSGTYTVSLLWIDNDGASHQIASKTITAS